MKRILLKELLARKSQGICASVFSTLQNLNVTRFIHVRALIRNISLGRTFVSSNLNTAGHFKLLLKVLFFSQIVETILFFTFSIIHNSICNTLKNEDL